MNCGCRPALYKLGACCPLGGVNEELLGSLSGGRQTSVFAFGSTSGGRQHTWLPGGREVKGKGWFGFLLQPRLSSTGEKTHVDSDSESVFTSARSFKGSFKGELLLAQPPPAFTRLLSFLSFNLPRAAPRSTPPPLPLEKCSFPVISSKPAQQVQ